MSKADITINLSGGVATFESIRFLPGSTISGEAVIYPNEDINCKRLVIILGWQTRGRGTRYSKTIEEREIFQGELRQGMPRTFNFSFTLPHEPWSHEGHYVSIDWLIQVKIDIPFAKDTNELQTFLLYPDPPETGDDTWGVV